MLNSDSKSIILETLQSYWGYNSLLSNQEGPVESLTSGSDTLAILPTGGGKSLCNQLAALSRGGMCLVISPVIALMEDQCDQLKRLGIKAEALTSSLGEKGIDRVLENASIGKVDFSEQMLEENLSSLIAELNRVKPASAKGKYLKKISVSSSMGLSLNLDQGLLA